METQGGKPTKETFPSLIAQLLATFNPGLCKAGFRSTGFTPFSREHVLSKLPPIANPIESDSSLKRREHTKHLSCTNCGHKMQATPLVKTRLASHFSTLLEVHVHKERPKRGERNKARVRLEGEAITSDEFIEILAAQKREKEQKKSKTRQETVTTPTRKGIYIYT